MSSLYIGVSGLNASQNALNTTAHNLTNVDTKGFVRQQVLLKDTQYRYAKTPGVSSNQVGSGVDTYLVRQVRDSFLDKSYRLEVGRQGFYDAQYMAVSEIENVFGELEGVAFQDSIESLWVSMQELVKEPDSLVQRDTMVQTAVSLIERADLIKSQLQEYQKNLNTEILDSVNTINEIGTQIKALNDKICSIESAGLEQANDYRDTRNLLLDQLGQLVNISYRENSNGLVTVTVEGVPFVTEADVNAMGVAQLSETNDMLKPVWPFLGQDVLEQTTAYSSNDNTDVGYLKGLLVARGDYEANYTDIPVKPTLEDFQGDESAFDKAMAQYEKDVEAYNNTVNPSCIMTTQAQFDQLIHGLVTKINDILSPNKTITIVENGVEKEISILDEDTAPIGMGEGNDKAGTELFSRKNTNRYEKVEVYLAGSDTPTEVWRYNEEDANDPYSLYTLGQIEVNPDVLKNLSSLPLSAKENTGDYDSTICDQLVDLWNKDFGTLGPNNLTSNTLKDYYSAMIGELGNRGNTLNVIATNQEEMATSIDSQRASVTGVSSDEELSNMIRYQHAYNASARYINVVSEMLEHIINSL